MLVLYLTAEKLSEQKIGFLLTMTLLGDVVISLWITTTADRIGRKWMLIVGALLMVMVGVVFALTSNYVVLLITVTIGVLIPGDKEAGPFISIEQAALSQTIFDDQRTLVFAWYNLVGITTAALGHSPLTRLSRIRKRRFYWSRRLSAGESNLGLRSNRIRVGQLGPRRFRPDGRQRQRDTPDSTTPYGQNTETSSTDGKLWLGRLGLTSKSRPSWGRTASGAARDKVVWPLDDRS